MYALGLALLLLLGSFCDVGGENPCGQLIQTAGPDEVVEFNVALNCAGQYCADLVCNYTLCTTSAFMELVVNEMDIEVSAMCQFDSLTINGINHCGTQVPDPIVVPAPDNNCAYVQFESDSANGGTGFNITFQALTLAETLCSSAPCQNGGSCIPLTRFTVFQCNCPFGFAGTLCEIDALCASGVYAGNNLTIQSPKYCSSTYWGQTYCPNQHCVYTVCTETTLAFAFFTLLDTDTSSGCYSDRVIVKDATFCSSDMFPAPFLVSDTDTCFNVSFITNAYSEREGFSLRVVGKCFLGELVAGKQTNNVYTVSPLMLSENTCVTTNCPADHGCMEGSTCLVQSGVEGYHCHCPPDRTGDKCEYSYTRGCGQLSFDTVTGVMAAARVCHGGSYCSDLDCTYSMCTGTPYTLITVISADFDYGCTDKLVIGDMEVCGPSPVLPPPLVIPATTDEGCATLQFITNAWSAGNGFELTFEGLTETTCSSNPCMNGGLCVPAYNTFTCNCFNEFVGTLCQTSLLTTPEAAPEVEITTQRNPQFVETMVGIVIIGVTCTFGILTLALIGYYFYQGSSHSNRVRPLSGLDDERDDLHVYDITTLYGR